STIALKEARQLADSRGLAQVELFERTADDFSDLAAGGFDLVILNSEVQYFPDVVYLRRVLDGAIRVGGEGGHIFVGDVRSLTLLEAFAASIELERAEDQLARAEMRERVRRRVRQEQELLISPDFFAALGGSIRAAEVEPKRGWAQNELM